MSFIKCNRPRDIRGASWLYLRSCNRLLDGGGQRIMKIGRTGRTPDKRVRELSRGGPTGMVLVGAVSCRNMIELEKRAHLQFQHVRFPSGGGTEYFMADPDGLLKWLREETPRFDLESARKDAWAECVESRPF